MERAFEMLDTDGNGTIEEEELLGLIGGLGHDIEVVRKMIQEQDSDGDGKISFPEFMTMMQNLTQQTKK